MDRVLMICCAAYPAWKKSARSSVISCGDHSREFWLELHATSKVPIKHKKISMIGLVTMQSVRLGRSLARAGVGLASELDGEARIGYPKLRTCGSCFAGVSPSYFTGSF